MSNLTVHQPSNRPRPRCMPFAVVAVGLPQTIVATHTTESVFYDYTHASKGSVVLYVLWWSLFVLSSWSVLVRASRFATRREAQPLRVERGYAYIR